jgi:ABC-2 type transport system permease protein
MNYRLARPVAPIHEAIADNIAYKCRSATVVLLAWLVAAAVWPAVRVPFEPGRWALAAAAVVLAAAIRFLSGYATGLLAFWTTRATAVQELQWGVSLFLSGRIAPLSLLPPSVAAVAGVLWFPYMLAFPVEVLTGEVATPGALARGFAGQAVWLAAWWGAYRLVWRRGLVRYGAVGG